MESRVPNKKRTDFAKTKIIINTVVKYSKKFSSLFSLFAKDFMEIKQNLQIVIFKTCTELSKRSNRL